MFDPFVAPLFIAGEILLGLSLTTFVGASMATISNNARWPRR
jgi:hypothetical protein